MNHEQDESVEHECEGKCHYQAQYDNRIFTCRVSYTLLSWLMCGCNQLQNRRLIFQASEGKHEVAEVERRAPDTCDLTGTLPSPVSGTPRPLRVALVVAFLKHKMRSKLDGVCGWLKV